MALLDVNLRGHQSFPIAEVLRRRGIPFMFASGYGPEATQARFPGVTNLRKPFSMEMMDAKIRELLGSTGTSSKA